MKVKLKSSFIVLLCILIGCTTSNDSNIIRKSNGNKISYYSSPGNDEESIVHWGVSILNSKVVLLTNDYIYLNEGFSKFGKKDYHPIGAYEFKGFIEKYAVYESPINISNSLYSTILYAKIYEDIDGKIYYDYRHKENVVQNSDYEKVIKYEKSSIELVLTPIAHEGSILKVLFEYYDNMNIISDDGIRNIRNKVTEKNISYDLRDGNIIRYKSAIIEINFIDNQTIRYKVLSGFSEDDVMHEAYINIK
mgnify:CR=1 FL=1